ncbi:MAG TPA: FAD-binding protein, partial [Spongiibacteraceae bacterium]|nr:FAD-binding protein [Spongiibacteraceae bacterium]
NSRVLALIVDDNQAVHGVLVRRDNTLHCVRARRGVILCAGGFIMNTDMLAQHAPQLLRATAPLGTGGDDGAAIRMGMNVGAATLNMHEGLVTLPFYPPASLLKGILIDEHGHRFINEDCYHGRTGHYIFQQPATRIFLLADNAIFARPKFSAMMSIEIAAVAESWGELEQELKLPDGALLETITNYNEHAARGGDPQFHKAPEWLQPLLEPPFVALDCSSDACRYSAFTLGGLATLPSGEVLNEQQQIIAGLFAAGRTTCGLPRWGGGYSSGLSLGDATFFGRMAGLRAAGAAFSWRQ